MPEKPRVPDPNRNDGPLWRVLERLPAAIIALGGLGTVVGVVAGQPLGIVAVDFLGVVIGVILLLLLRWR